MHYTPETVTEINENEVFVFGSNLAGHHGAGAAKAALAFGACYGVGEGYEGATYAIPTKDKILEVRSLENIQDSVNLFLKFAEQNPDKIFLLTPIGTGYAGYTADDIAPLFESGWGLPNIVWPLSFIEILAPDWETSIRAMATRKYLEATDEKRAQYDISGNVGQLLLFPYKSTEWKDNKVSMPVS